MRSRPACLLPRPRDRQPPYPSAPSVRRNALLKGSYRPFCWPQTCSNIGRRPGTPNEMRSDLPSQVTSVRTTIKTTRPIVRRRGTRGEPTAPESQSSPWRCLQLCSLSPEAPHAGRTANPVTMRGCGSLAAISAPLGGRERHPAACRSPLSSRRRQALPGRHSGNVSELRRA
jgi:hypothetical protein